MEIDKEIINPTRGIPQGSEYGPLLFTLYINNILTQTETKFKDITILAFIDDIMIASKNLKVLEEAMNFIHDMIEELNMELNLNKCELLSENEEDTIVVENNPPHSPHPPHSPCGKNNKLFNQIKMQKKINYIKSRLIIKIFKNINYKKIKY